MITLKNVLRLNAISSGLTGLVLVFFPKTIAQLFHSSAWTPFSEVGIFLIVFAVIVIAISSTMPIRPKAVQYVIMLDTLWVAASLAMIIFQLFSLSTIGYAMIGGVALWVCLMIYLQKTTLHMYTAS
jgi:hypothetical protein